MRIGTLEKGDMIKCHDAEEAGYIADRLQGYDWDFVYEHDGQKGIWIEILGEVQGMILDEAIQSFKDEMEKQTALGHSEHIDNLEQMSEWLKELKDYRENTCGDAISRQEAIRAIEALQRPIMREESNYYQFKFSGMSEAREAVENLPSVSPQQKVGRWVISEVRCPDCLEYFDADNYSFEKLNICPNCGAKMEVK